MDRHGVPLDRRVRHPRGLSVLHIDRENDLGSYVEPNVWVRHR